MSTVNPKQWPAARTLLAGIFGRIDGPDFARVHDALERVVAVDLVQFELMMIFSALQQLHRTGEPFTHEKILEAVRSLEPGKIFGFACIVFEHYWEHRSQVTISDDIFDSAVTLLANLRRADNLLKHGT